VQYRQIDGALDVEAETPPGQMLAQDGLTAGLAPEMAEHQIGANAAAAQFRQLAAVEAGQHDGAAGMTGCRGDQAVEQAGGLDLIAPAERLDDPLDVAAALADVLDEVEILVAADLLDTNEHGWCPDWGTDTMANLVRSRILGHCPVTESRGLAPQFCRDLQNAQYSVGFPAEWHGKCGSWVRVDCLNGPRQRRGRIKDERNFNDEFIHSNLHRAAYKQYLFLYNRKDSVLTLSNANLRLSRLLNRPRQYPHQLTEVGAVMARVTTALTWAPLATRR